MPDSNSPFPAAVVAAPAFDAKKVIADVEHCPSLVEETKAYQEIINELTALLTPDQLLQAGANLEAVRLRAAAWAQEDLDAELDLPEADPVGAEGADDDDGPSDEE